MKLVLLLSLLIPLSSMAVPEESFSRDINEKVLPHFRTLTSGTLVNQQGLKLKYFFHKNPNNHKSLLIVPGRTEPAYKYAELIYDLKDSGFDIFIMDLQGQGESSRILADSQKGHVINFYNYVADMEEFIKKVVVSKATKPLYLIAHSMGGAISTLYMNRNPNVIKKAVLVAPMFEMNTHPYSEAVARIYSKFLISVGKGNHYAPGYGPFVASEHSFETNVLTRSKVRFEQSKNIFISFPKLTVSGPTAKWVNESLKTTRKIDRIHLETPVLILQAGQDRIVNPGRQESFCRKGGCELINFHDANHEILMEKDSIRNEALKEIESFFGI